MIQNKSVGGFGIELTKPIPVGTTVSLTLPRSAYQGVVRHCSENKEQSARGKFLIGIEIVPKVVANQQSKPDIEQA